MACHLCDRGVRIPRGAGGLFVAAPVSEITTKILDLVRGWPEALTPREGTLQGRTDDFEAFLTKFQKSSPWSAVERQSVSVLFVPEGQELNFRSFQETRTLDQWAAVDDAAFLATIIEDEALMTVFHPIWHMASQTIYGWECLTRGIGPDGSLVSPGRLFAVAKAAGAVFPLDRLARLTALRHARSSSLLGKFFINFVPTAIYDPVFCLRTTVGLARDLGFDPGDIVFEVVESEQIDDEDHLKKIVDYYRGQGFGVALDDVGSGYSSLNLLVALNPDVIKVDLKIIRNIDHKPASQAVFRALAAIAKETGALLLAEGIETKAERDWTKDNGADLGQGFLWGPPQPDPDPHQSY